MGVPSQSETTVCERLRLRDEWPCRARGGGDPDSKDSSIGAIGAVLVRVSVRVRVRVRVRAWWRRANIRKAPRWSRETWD